ncbi:hypothetical protein BDR03DRAFT_1013687 [Suillus americanus]|nr:hypothetical protein BDR03DRAFT_1013687 [Suillus americanus]
MSEDDYRYILNAIRSNDKLVHKPSYIPSLQQLITTLPSPIHESIFVPLCTTMGIALNSFVISDDFDVLLCIHMAHMVDVPATADLPPDDDESYHLGIPDLVVALETHDAKIRPYWPFEVSVSQTSEGALMKLQTFSDWNEHMLAATHISVVEAKKHTSPSYEWGVEKQLD